MTRRLFFAIAAMGTAQIAVYVVRPMTSYRLLGLGFGAREVGLVAAAFALLPLFLAIPLGRYADRRHGLRLLTLGCGVQLIGCLLLASAESPLGLGAASAVLGLGHLGLALGAQSVVARDSGDRHHDQHFGWLTLAVAVGQLIGPLVGGLLAGNDSGAALVADTTRAMLVAAAIAGIAVVFGVAAERSRSVVATTPPDAPRGSLAAILGTRGVPAGIFASVAVLSASDVFTAYMPVLGEERGISPAIVGGLLAMRAGASIVSRVGIGALVRRVGRIRLLTLNALGAAVALTAITFVDDVWSLFALSALLGAGLGFGQPLSMTLIVQRVPEHARATALAVRLAGNRVGQVATPAAAGAVAGAAGTGSVFWMLSGMLVVSAVTIRRRPNQF